MTCDDYCGCEGTSGPSAHVEPGPCHRPAVPKPGHHPGCVCGCHSGPFGFRRRFTGKKELLQRLRDYLEELRAEAEAVEERIRELESDAR
ncbi:MAG: hypothetical protein K6U08_00725 [Firmicutes bacterium]|nr:hypothetical protein [Bacillota bacterium]